MWGKCGDDKNKKPSYMNNMKVFITTKVVRTGTKPINFNVFCYFSKSQIISQINY